MKRTDGRTLIDPVKAAALVKSDRWLSKIEITENGCWQWTAQVSQNGYGRISLDSQYVRSNRVALVAKLGRDLADGMEAGHICHDLAFAEGRCDAGNCSHRRCVNPAHLAEQSAQENVRAGGSFVRELMTRTHCPQGHALAQGNLEAHASTKGWRVCLACNRERSRANAVKFREAHRLIGVSQSDFRARFGRSHAVLDTILANAETIAASDDPVATALLFTGRAVA